MPTVTVAAADHGAYEKALVADTPQSVQISFRGLSNHYVDVVHNSGASPLYVGRATLAAKAVAGIQVVPGARVRINVPQGGTIWVVSAATAAYSIVKP